jgi:hypothetical protein
MGKIFKLFNFIVQSALILIIIILFLPLFFIISIWGFDETFGEFLCL